MEYTLRWKTTIRGKWPSAVDYLWSDLLWKTTFGWRRPSVEDVLQWKTTFGSDSFPWQSQQNWAQTGIAISCAKKTTFLGKDNIKMWMGGRIIGPILHHSFQRRKATNEWKKGWEEKNNWTHNGCAHCTACTHSTPHPLCGIFLCRRLRFGILAFLRKWNWKMAQK